MIMPVYSSGSRPAWSPSRVFRLAYFDARPEARIQAVYDGRCPRDEAAQEEEEAAALLRLRYRRYRTVFTRPILSGYLTRINETRIVSRYKH